jgi:serine/threonine-protein kinase
MEFLEGLDAEFLVEQFGPLAANRAVYLLIQACDSLEEAHQCGIVHRDIKPGNIYVCRVGCHYDFVKILDFGLARYQGERGKSETRLTNAGVITGTPAFVAPEVAMESGSIDGRADIYALGCVAYWLLTGTRVFDGATSLEVVMHHVKTPAVPPSERTELKIPPKLEATVMRCLEKDPANRPSSVRELLSELQQCQDADPWTRQKAERWWKLHRPLAGFASLPSGVEVSPLSSLVSFRQERKAK